MGLGDTYERENVGCNGSGNGQSFWWVKTN